MTLDCGLTLELHRNKVLKNFFHQIYTGKEASKTSSVKIKYLILTSELNPLGLEDSII